MGPDGGNEVVDGLVERVTREEIMEVMQKTKCGKAIGPSEISLEKILASAEMKLKVMVDQCQRILDGRRIFGELKTNVIVLIFKEMVVAMSYG